MKIDCDWHMHSHHSPCGKEGGTLALMVQQAKAAGIRELGITDHLHTCQEEGRYRASRAEFDALPDHEGVRFGLEVSCVRQLDLEHGRTSDMFPPVATEGNADSPLALHLPEALLEELKTEYIVAGTHWPLGAPTEQQAMIRSYHRQNMFLATHPKVNILAHPWWWMGAWRDPDRDFYPNLPWLDDLSVIPQSMHDEYAAAVKEHGKVVEINASAMLLNQRYPESFRPQYLEYLAYLKGKGVQFSVGSDSHHPGYIGNLPDIEGDLDELGIEAGDLWRLEA